MFRGSKNMRFRESSMSSWQQNVVRAQMYILCVVKRLYVVKQFDSWFEAMVSLGQTKIYGRLSVLDVLKDVLEPDELYQLLGGP